MSRRAVVRAGMTLGGVTFLGTSALVERLLAQSTCSDAPLGELIGLVPLHSDRPRLTPFGELVGGPGLDARLFTDLSRLEPDRLITPTPEMFVRTAVPPALRTTPQAWTIRTGDRGGTGAARTSNDGALSLNALRREAEPMGAHLIECSGNSDPDNFGLMSVTEWDGVPLAQVVAQLPPRPGAAAVLVGGLDDHAQDARSSNPGATWVFALDALERHGAFLAVRMNGEPLTPHHGAPVRLVVPGWYGCSWIKWVNELRLVDADHPVTPQMLEFSSRTHQGQVAALARSYEPPIIDVAATPIRVEKRRVEGRLEYRIVGIVWGGQQPVDRLMIRFTAGEPAQAFALCPAPRTHRTWSLWEYRWRPRDPGVYNIVLTAADPAIRTRRLDVSFYVRRVVIDEI